MRNSKYNSPASFANYIHTLLISEGAPFPNVSIQGDNYLDIPSDITNIPDDMLDQLYFTAQTIAAMLSLKCAEADIQKQFAENEKERQYSIAILESREPSIDDRKADAFDSSLHEKWNMIYLRKLAIYKELFALKLSWERIAETYSRIMARRKLMWEQENSS